MRRIWLHFSSRMNLHTLRHAELWLLCVMGEKVKKKKSCKAHITVNKIGHPKENNTSTGSKKKIKFF